MALPVKAVSSVLAGAMLTVSGCVAVTQEKPALRVDEDAAGQAELEAAAARLVGATRMLLARDAFRTEPQISVARQDASSLDELDDGRVRLPPVAVRLYRIGDRCALRRVDDGAAVELEFVRCAPFREGPEPRR